MKIYKFQYILFISLLCFAFVSCKKTEQTPVLTHLTLFNAMPGQLRLLPSFRGTEPLNRYYLAILFDYGVFNVGGKYAITKEDQPLAIYSYPDTLSPDKPLFDLQLKLKKGSINTLYFLGKKENPDYLLDTYLPPVHQAADSTFGIRFINLSYGSKPINVYLIKDGERKEVEGLAYKGITNFKSYTATLKTGNYTFEFRDQATQELLASYTTTELEKPSENKWRFRNFTIALIGLPGESSELLKQKTFLFDNY
ncbi:hypothetical protein AQ505_15775 [Pedobacter sp. PACM 27299]|uniref:DUF4397 domain-containing protein n=1 Tax=Pedobacter sp. PACM 27299 TaxID=1727164 RepID=UPI00070616B7|nr:DUF4397 domain-containing protein [Pedobacter sp. PACM 27299]ALL06819.1 hypothetical protein AQ505_15775 [Pedobacter sp. PACM 27299]